MSDKITQCLRNVSFTPVRMLRSKCCRFELAHLFHELQRHVQPLRWGHLPKRFDLLRM